MMTDFLRSESSVKLPKFKKGLSALCWAYNESMLIEAYLRRLNDFLNPIVEDYEIVVVDDGSTDGTPEIVRNLQKEIPNIVLHRNERNMDIGVALPRAVQSATKEYLFWQTADWSYDIRYFRIYLELLNDYDVVVGTRRSAVQWEGSFVSRLRNFFKIFNFQHFSSRSDNKRKAFVSLVNYALIRLLFRVPLSDFQNVCIYPTRLVQSFRYESNSSFGNPEGLIKAYWSGASIVEVPIPFVPRTAGKAKGTRLKAIRASLRDVFGLWFKWMVLGKLRRVRGKTARLRDYSLQSILEKTNLISSR